MFGLETNIIRLVHGRHRTRSLAENQKSVLVQISTINNVNVFMIFITSSC